MLSTSGPVVAEERSFPVATSTTVALPSAQPVNARRFLSERKPPRNDVPARNVLKSGTSLTKDKSALISRRRCFRTDKRSD